MFCKARRAAAIAKAGRCRSLPDAFRKANCFSTRRTSAYLSSLVSGGGFLEQDQFAALTRGGGGLVQLSSDCLVTLLSKQVVEKFGIFKGQYSPVTRGSLENSNVGDG